MLESLQAVGSLQLASIARIFGDVARMGALGTTCAQKPVRTVIHVRRCMGLMGHMGVSDTGADTRTAAGVIIAETTLSPGYRELIAIAPLWSELFDQQGGGELFMLVSQQRSPFQPTTTLPST